MNAFVPKHWIPVSRETFEAALHTFDWYRDGWANGIRYHLRHNREPFAFDYEDGRILMDPKLLNEA